MGIVITGSCCRRTAIKEGKCYPHKESICSHDGTPVNDRLSYLPDSFYVENNWQKHAIWSEFIEDYSQFMHLAKEPILYNNYIGRPVFRYTDFDGITMPVSISIAKKGSRWSIRTTTFSRNPGRDTLYYSTADDGTVTFKKNIPFRIIASKERLLSWKEWHAFEHMLDSCGFPNMQKIGIKKAPVCCGSQSFLEIHVKSNYYFTDDTGTIGSEMIMLSDYAEYFKRFR